ncbi:hypothetical protein TVAG_130340 [Trichomonas vaginalis G3]|uniref:Uncharacterized protein n=1 Tax=Trichomonas vaginalis (strain ATCC PRA-98 / G3) TaxID=412133 RepID=A2DID0_TRIV3|nr:hypothetical protein TVAGG3_0711570 [Trichomonas vaginalis G3]EAY19926.1 hypothetical protein TVAG_130340 [Trichomonas vaginalis G3]KAI5509939.1 hypothetical protein TVAGG3_0711570 [Trichomonas vaginalis G3]|eukprot:XP_001580912.1 hypothetical protein [Trichomonas vaginalis G3]
MPTEYCPFTLLDDKNYDKEFLITTQFNVFRNLSKYSPSGYMINTWIGFPQYTKWAAMLGYEVNIEKIFSSDFLYFWQTRIALGSRPISHLQLAGSWDKFEEYFSYCSVVGCTPSSEIGGFWNKDENMNKVKPTYDKWREPLMEMLTETTFLANGGGKVKFVNDEWGVFCKKDGTCYASFAIRNESTDYIATVDKNPECFFVPEGVTCKTDGNNVTISSKNKYRSAIIKFDGVVLEEKSKVGLIVGLTIFFVKSAISFSNSDLVIFNTGLWQNNSFEYSSVT